MNRVRTLPALRNPALRVPALAVWCLILAGCSQPESPAAGSSVKVPPAAENTEPDQTPPPSEAPKAADDAKPAAAAASNDAAATDTAPPADGMPRADEGPKEDGAAPDNKPVPDTKTATKPAPDTKPDAKPESDDGASAASTVDGKELYLGKCKSCHGADGKGDTSLGKKTREAGGEFPSLAGSKLAKAKIIEILENGIPDTKMKSYKDKLTAEEIGAVATYVKKL